MIIDKKVWLAILLNIAMSVYAGESVEIPDSGGNQFYKSIGRLRGEMSCTVSFVQFSDNLNAKAIFLSNGHCAQDAFNPSSGNNVFVDKEVNYTAKFNYFKDTADSDYIDVKINKVVYSTMSGNDISVMESDEAVGQLINKGLMPYRVATQKIDSDTPIIVAGIPIDVGALQLSLCQAGENVDVIEGYWHWYDLSENSCQGISEGSSGSPVFDTNNNIVGLLNTTTRTAIGSTCYIGNPCVIDGQGAHIRKDRNYVVPVEGLQQCFDQDGHFSLSSKGCTLQKPDHLTISEYPYVFSGEHSPHQNWKFHITNAEGRIRYKEIHLTEPQQNCKDLSGYSLPIDANDIEFSSMKIDSSKEGIHQICIIDENGDGRSPKVIQLQVDNTPPDRKPLLDVTPWGFEPIFLVPEYIGYWLAWGAPDTLDCATAKYHKYMRQPISIDTTPLKVCLYGYDAADNISGVYQYLIE